jgi:hypothetical protein
MYAYSVYSLTPLAVINVDWFILKVQMEHSAFVASSLSPVSYSVQMDYSAFLFSNCTLGCLRNKIYRGLNKHDLGSYVMELVLIIGSDLLINIRILVFYLIPRRWPVIECFMQASNHCYMVSEFTDFS